MRVWIINSSRDKRNLIDFSFVFNQPSPPSTQLDRIKFLDLQSERDQVIDNIFISLELTSLMFEDATFIYYSCTTMTHRYNSWLSNVWMEMRSNLHWDFNPFPYNSSKPKNINTITDPSISSIYKRQYQRVE